MTRYKARYINAEPYEADRIVANNEDEGIAVKDIETADVQEVKHGEWVLVAHTGYYDEDYPDGCVYVTANCSYCGCEAKPYQIYHATILRPDEYQFDSTWRFDEQKEKANALKIASEKKLSPYCYNCGAKMDGESNA